MKKHNFPVHLILAVLAAVAVVSAAAPAQAASKETVYVLTEIYYGQKDENGLTFTYKYNKNGLLKSYNLRNAQKGEYKYNSKKQLVKFRRSLNEWCNFDYTYNKKGQLTKIKSYYTDMKTNKYAYDGFVSKLTYNKKGQVIKKTDTGKVALGEDGQLQKVTFTKTYKYNKKGQVKQTVFTNSANKAQKQTANYKYDKKGNLKSVSYSDGYKQEMNLSYNKNKTLKSISGGESVTSYYSWKKMKVSKKLAAQVKAQQWSLINQDLNLVIPTNDYGM